MQPLIVPSAYSSSEVYRLEERMLFRRHWQFAAFAYELQNENDFVTRDIGGKAVFVQRIGGELKCFENVCPHRFNRLHTACRGNARLRCGYHGWTFDGQGIPCAIPHRPRFDDLTPEALKSLQLASWEVEQCGNLIFVR